MINRKQGMQRPVNAQRDPNIDFQIKAPMYTDKLNMGPGSTLIIEKPFAKSDCSIRE